MGDGGVYCIMFIPQKFGDENQGAKTVGMGVYILQ